jgi:hypothetical protein
MQALRKNLICVLCSFLLLLLFAQPAFSETVILENSLPADTIVEELFQGGSGLPVGKIQSVRGEVIVYHRDPTVGYQAKTGLPLYYGDTISTRNNGRILCRLIDGTLFLLVSETTLTIFQCNYNSARKTSVSFLSLKHGYGRFQVKAKAEVLSHEFKIQTDTAYAQAQDADFIIRASQDTTEIITFEQSRLEVTNLAEPEVIFFLSDFQRALVEDKSDLQSGPQMVETVSQDEAEEMIAETRLLPQSHLFASSAEKYLEEDTAAEALKSGSIAEDYIENPNPDKPEFIIDY